MFNCGACSKYNNTMFYNFIKNELDIPLNLFNIHLLKDDNNCYYKCLSIFLFDKIDYHEALRKEVSNFCKQNKTEINNFQNEVELGNGVFISTNEYINNMDKDRAWATDIDITISTYLFGINVAVYVHSDEANNLENNHSYIYQQNASHNPVMILIKETPNHFDLLFPKGDAPEIKQFCSNFNPFPKYTIGKDQNLYLNIYNFLRDGVKNGKRTWPDYIENIKDKKTKRSQKLNFYRKVGLIKDTRKFIRDNKDIDINEEAIYTKDKYLIENDRLYVTRYEYNNNYEKKLVNKKYMIPYNEEINDILIKCHSKNQGRDGTINSIKAHNYYWINMVEDVNRFLRKLANPDSSSITMSTPIRNDEMSSTTN